jgi:hypothetical protein
VRGEILVEEYREKVSFPLRFSTPNELEAFANAITEEYDD